MTGPCIVDCNQNTDEWLTARMGIPTASCFHKVLAKGQGKVRRDYMLRLAGEIVSGEPMDNFTNHHMERGHEMEDEARNLYSFMNEIDATPVGFVRNGDVGASPDSFIGDSGILEIKTKMPHLMVDVILKDKFPTEHIPQCQGCLWVAEREWIDIVVYWPKMPPFIKRAYRDEEYIKNLSSEVSRFNEELSDMVEKVQHYGAS